MSVYCCKRVLRYRLSPETFGYTLALFRNSPSSVYEILGSDLAGTNFILVLTNYMVQTQMYCGRDTSFSAARAATIFRTKYPTPNNTEASRPEDGGSKVLRNGGILLQHYMT